MKIKKITTVREVRYIAKQKIQKKIFDWMESGAEDDYTKLKNSDDLKKIIIKPAHLLKIKKISLQTNFFGKKISSPLLLSPMGHQTQFNKDGEIEMCKGTHMSNTVGFFSTQGRISLDDIRKKNPKANIAWTIFPFGDKDWILDQIKTAERNKVLCIAVCIDANVRSHRYQDRENKYDARKIGRRTNPISPNPEEALNYGWELIRFIKSQSKLPIIVKGVLTNEDIKKSINFGADAIWISNHGGRMLNSGMTPVNSMIELNKIKIKENIKIIVDGGVMKGSDILKYLLLGADYVGVGRAALYGLISSGHKNVNNVFNILNEELYASMINGGFKSYAKNFHRLILN